MPLSTFRPKAPQRERKDRSDEFANWSPRPRAPVQGSGVVMALCKEPAKPVPKEGRFESNAWRRAVASLPCVLCGREGQTQCAHRNEGKGMALKVSDALTAALCVSCHADIDQGSQHTKAERRERMDRAILLTLRELAHRGLVVPA